MESAFRRGVISCHDGPRRPPPWRCQSDVAAPRRPWLSLKSSKPEQTERRPADGEDKATYLEGPRPAHQAQSLGVRHRRKRKTGAVLQGGVDQGGRRERLGGAPAEGRPGAEGKGRRPDTGPGCGALPRHEGAEAFTGEGPPHPGALQV